MNHYNTQCIYFRTIVSYSHNILINEIQEYAVNFWEINPETICSLNVTTRCEYRFWQFVIKHMFLANFCLVMHPIGLKSCQEIHWEMQSDIELEFSKSYNLQLVWFFPLHARQVARQGVWSALNIFFLVDSFTQEWFTACHKELWQPIRKKNPCIAIDKNSSLKIS